MTKKDLKELANNLNAIDFSKIELLPPEGGYRMFKYKITMCGETVEDILSYQDATVIASSNGKYGCNGRIFRLQPINWFVYADNPYVGL